MLRFRSLSSRGSYRRFKRAIASSSTSLSSSSSSSSRASSSGTRSISASTGLGSRAISGSRSSRSRATRLAQQQEQNDQRLAQQQEQNDQRLQKLQEVRSQCLRPLLHQTTPTSPSPLPPSPYLSPTHRLLTRSLFTRSQAINTKLAALRGELTERQDISVRAVETGLVSTTPPPPTHTHTHTHTHTALPPCSPILFTLNLSRARGHTGPWCRRTGDESHDARKRERGLRTTAGQPRQHGESVNNTETLDSLSFSTHVRHTHTMRRGCSRIQHAPPLSS